MLHKLSSITRSYGFVIFLTFLYLSTHFFKLNSLPIFADESIYIRWAQLITDDWQQYAFFALNDGKTPLFIWLLAPFQLLQINQLWSARSVSVLIGLTQVFAIGYFTKILGGKRTAQFLAMFFTLLLPFWFFHHRLAMIDGLLTLCLTFTMIGIAKIISIPLDIKNTKQLVSLKSWQFLLQRTSISAMLWTGLGLGAALWTKVPAVLILPSIAVWPWWKKSTFATKLMQLITIGVAVLLGLTVFALLKFSPAFGQLFNRGSDFLYPVSEIVSGTWRQTIGNIPTYIAYFGVYLGWGVLALNIVGLFTGSAKRLHHVLFWSAILFALPIALLGKVVYPRYFFPAAIFLTINAALVLASGLTSFIPSRKQLYSKALYSFLVALFFAQLIQYSTIFALTSWFAPNAIPFVPADQTQYLTEWSSGHGIAESVALLDTLAADHTVAVATEGFFGTLPDGVLVYQHGKNVTNLYVEGVGQPVNSITQKFYDRAINFDQILLIVNSHRLQLDLPQSQLLANYCRPYRAPCLQVWDITPQVLDGTIYVRPD